MCECLLRLTPHQYIHFLVVSCVVATGTQLITMWSTPTCSCSISPHTLLDCNVFIAQYRRTSLCCFREDKIATLYSPHMHVEGKKWVSYWATQITLYSICWWKIPTNWVCHILVPQVWCVWAAPCHSFSPHVWNMISHCFLWHIHRLDKSHSPEYWQLVQ